MAVLSAQVRRRVIRLAARRSAAPSSAWRVAPAGGDRLGR
jgi:hypothetical protein